MSPYLIKCKTCRDYVVTPDRKRVFCSRRCFGIQHASDVSGSKSGTWNGGLITSKCLVCAVAFRSKPSDSRQFCSRACKSRSQSKTVALKCSLCGRGPIHRKPSSIRRLGTFCNRSCATTFLNHKTESWKRFTSLFKKRTSIEIMIAGALTRSGIPFREQVEISVARTRPDFVLPKSVVVYCDGDYWHAMPKNAQRDQRTNEALRRLGYLVYRFGEASIRKSPDACVKSIKEFA